MQSTRKNYTHCRHEINARLTITLSDYARACQDLKNATDLRAVRELPRVAFCPKKC